MNANPETLTPDPLSPAAPRGWRGVAVPARLPVFAVCTVVAVLISCMFGQDVGWDTRNYHLYAGFSALHDRFGQDYFAAGPQSYFNPYAYVPFYALVRAGLSPLTISCLLALAQSTILWITYELGVLACPSTQPRIRLLCGACAAVLALLNPVFLCQLGSSYADISTAVFVLCGWLLLAHVVRAPRLALVIGAGLLLGAAAGLKLTNAVHVVAVATMLILVPRPLLERARYGLAYGLAVAGGVTVTTGVWAYRLLQQFGNPFFPLLNNVFRSPQFTTDSLRQTRFIPGTLAEALWRPFAIAQPDSMVYVEQMAPDARYAALLLVLAAVAGRWLWLRHRGQLRAWPSAAPGSWRVPVALGCALTIDWALWLYASGNGRYFLPGASVAAVLLVTCLLRAFAVRTCVLVLGAVFTIQGVQLYMASDLRGGALAWDHPWLDVQLPPSLATEPNLYLTIGMQSNSFIAPYLPAGSGLVNFDGQYSLSLQGANGARIAALLHRYGTHVRVLMVGSRLHSDSEKEAPTASRVDDALTRLGLRTEAGDCQTIDVRGVPAPYVAERKGKKQEPRSPGLHLLTCATAAADPQDLARRAQSQRIVDLVLDRLEDACPQLFQPRRPQTQRTGDAWLRYYSNTDLYGFVNRGDVKFLGVMRGPDATYLGPASAWADAPLALACGRNGDVYFAKRRDQPATLSAR